MADRRMFAKTIIDSDAFIDMPLSTQALYFHLSMRADDDGFINNPKKIQRMICASDDDIKILITKKFIIPFESGIVVIKHWKIHNYIRGDRKKDTVYPEEMSLLEEKDNGAYTLKTEEVALIEAPKICMSVKCQSSDSQTTGKCQHRLGKDSIGKDSIGKNKSGKKRKVFVPPTYEEVVEYAKEKGREDLAKDFFDYFSVGEWVDSKGQKVVSWKQKFLTWSSRNEKKRNTVTETPKYSDFNAEDALKKAMERSYK